MENTTTPPASDTTQSKGVSSVDGKTAFHIKVYSPFKTYYDGVAQSLTATNDTGNFDILPHHKNFLTLLSAGDLVIRSEIEEVIPITQGIMLVKFDEVTVFLDA